MKRVEVVREEIQQLVSKLMKLNQDELRYLNNKLVEDAIEALTQRSQLEDLCLSFMAILTRTIGRYNRGENV